MLIKEVECRGFLLYLTKVVQRYFECMAQYGVDNEIVTANKQGGFRAVVLDDALEGFDGSDLNLF